MDPRALTYRLQALTVHFLLNAILAGTNWCNMDTGMQTIVDGMGYPHSVYISLTRDGSVWVRAGTDHKDRDWTFVREREHRFQDSIIGRLPLEMIKSFNYTRYCVLTDINLVLKAEGGWHPSYVNVYNPQTKRTMALSFNHTKDCYSETNITFTLNKQGFVCGGGKINTCGKRNLPDKGQHSPPLFLRNLRLDPRGPEHHTCPGYGDRNYYSFMGSYYHVYIKVAQCSVPKDSRTFGFESKLRPNRDPENSTNTVIIPDPTQRALNGAVIKGWRAFVKIVSLQHEIWLQVWRPSPYYSNTYTLVGQTFFAPRLLRFHEFSIQQERDMIRLKRGDVLGLYFPKQNPIGWSSVPCAGSGQTYRYLNGPKDVEKGKTFTFSQALLGDESACRHYAFTSIFANKTEHKVIEDWTCPTATIHPDTRKRSGNHNGRSGSYYTKAPEVQPTEPPSALDGTLPVHIILIIIGCLIALLTVIGFISYYKAIRS